MVELSSIQIKEVHSKLIPFRRKPDQEPFIVAQTIRPSTRESEASGSLEFKANLANSSGPCLKRTNKVQPVVHAVLGRLKQEICDKILP